MSSGSVRLEVVFGGVTALLRVAAGVCAYFPSPPPEGVEGCDMVVTCEGGRKEGEEGGKEGGEGEEERKASKRPAMKKRPPPP